MHLRLLQIEDIPQVVVLGKQLLDDHCRFDKDYYHLEDQFAVDFYAWVYEHLNSMYKFIYVADTDNKIVGFIAGYIKYLFPWFKIKSVGHIAYLVVNNDFQHKGIGKLLEMEAVNWFKAKNLPYVELYVDELNAKGITAWSSYQYQPFKKFLRKTI